MSADFVVFGFYSLGYERLQGKENFIITSDVKIQNGAKKLCTPDYSFAYPAETKNEGIFWLNYYSRVKIGLNFKAYFL